MSKTNTLYQSELESAGDKIDQLTMGICDLMNCAELNQDSLEPETIKLIERIKNLMWEGR